jgi:hypothetical protein
MAGDDNKEYTKGGNLKAPSFELMLSWVKVAWDNLDAELIRNSFVVCGQTSGRPRLISCILKAICQSQNLNNHAAALRIKIPKLNY